ncbi:hypothetical protein KV557_00085 [Kitasatospora aureofaciens]|nr:hypothetical protein [Kitasatospora aureofaciens]MBV6695524.1 hypothetical protein [Kitasatospora aureofaciens]
MYLDVCPLDTRSPPGPSARSVAARARMVLSLPTTKTTLPLGPGSG